MSLKFLTVPSKILAESITSVATSFRLNNIKGWDTEDLVSGDFGTQHFIIFRNATKTAVELMEIDPTTIASASITIVRRGLQFDGDLTTEVTANKLPWTKGDTYVDIGTDTPQMLQWLKEYIDDASIAGAVPASTSAAGIVKEATQAQADAGTGDDGTYQYIVPPDKMRAKNYNDYIVDTGTANTYAIAPSPAITAYAAGQIFTFKAATANTGASTLNVNGLGVKTIKRNVSLDLLNSDIQAGGICVVAYDGTYFQLLSSPGTSGDIIINAGETINGATLPVPVYQNTSDNEVYACDGNDNTKLKFIGFAITNSTDGNPIVVRTEGIVGGFSALDEGTNYWLSDTVGTIQNTPGTFSVLVGEGRNTTHLSLKSIPRKTGGVSGNMGTSSSSLAVTTGFRPYAIRISAHYASSGAMGTMTLYYVNGTVYASNCYYNEGTAGAASTDARLYTDAAATYFSFTITSVTNTGFTIVWTAQSTPSSGAYFAYEAEGM